MRYLVLASDYDGTLASHGRVDDTTLNWIRKLQDSGRRFLLVTGRELSDLQKVFPQLDLCELVVAENGGLLYNPRTKEERVLAEPPNPRFLAALKTRGVPFSTGRGVVATWEPHQSAVLDAIKELGLELQVSFNKGAVMVLPSGVNKESGLKCALQQLGISPHNVVGVGDAENDHVFLSACECGAAVANALPSLKDRADIVLTASHGAGVGELVDHLLRDDLESFDDQLRRHRLMLGRRQDDTEVCISPYRGSVLFAGPSGSGKSSAAAGIIERLAEKQYQFCLIDPEGDYENFMDALQFGNSQAPPEVSQVLRALGDPVKNVIVNLLGIALQDRPLFFASLLPQLLELRNRRARPHWIIVDEAHHLLPASWTPAAATLPQSLTSMIYITVHPEMVAPPALQSVEVAVAVGSRPGETLAGLARAISQAPPEVFADTLTPGQAVVWCPREEAPPFVIKVEEGKIERRRHLRKYANGELPADRSFYFRGPGNRLNLRAQNLQMFASIADGIDDDTWLFHLRRGDYSRWFRNMIKDPDLAAEAQSVEHSSEISADESRARIKAAIEQRYTAAA